MSAKELRGPPKHLGPSQLGENETVLKRKKFSATLNSDMARSSLALKVGCKKRKLSTRSILHKIELIKPSSAHSRDGTWNVHGKPVGPYLAVVKVTRAATFDVAFEPHARPTRSISVGVWRVS